VSTTRKLFLFCLVSFAFACLVSLPSPKTGELRFLAQVCLGWIYNDSSFYMDQAWAVFKSGKPIYQTLFFAEHVKFIYPPSSLLTYAIAEKLHLSGWRLIEMIDVLSLPATLAVAGEIFLLVSPPPADERHGKLYRRLLIAALGMLFYPLVSGASIGQIQTFMTFLWTLAVYCWLKNRTARAGMYLALICAFKPMLAVFLIWGLLRREWRFVQGFVVMAVVIQAVAIAVFGWRNEIDYLAVLSYLSHRGEALIANQTVNGLLERLLRNGSLVWSRTEYPPFNKTVYLGTMLSSVVLFGFGLLYPMIRGWKNRADRTQDFILFGMIATIATPIAWEHHYGYFYVGCVYFLALHLRPVTKSFYAFVACFLVLANSWRFLDRLATTHWSALLSYDLFAGLAVILLMAFATRSQEERVAEMGTGTAVHEDQLTLEPVG
jgi:hypothetical protein